MKNKKIEKNPPFINKGNEYINDHAMKKKESELKKKMRFIITSAPFSLFMSTLTVYTIFAIDLDKGFFTMSASFWFSIIHIFSMAIFISETILLVITQEEYLFGFYFWIDVFSTLTMLLEVIWIEDLMNSVQNLQMAISIARISKASRFSKIGARSTKIMKLIRLIKLIKFMRNEEKEEINKKKNEDSKCSQNGESDQSQNQVIKKNMSECTDYLTFLKQNKRQNYNFQDQIIERPFVDMSRQVQIERQWEELNNRLREGDQTGIDKQDSSDNTKVGKILKDQIQKNIVVMVMGVIIIVPLLSADTWFTKTAQFSFMGDEYIQVLYTIDNLESQIQFIQTFIKESQLASSSLCNMSVNDTLLEKQINYPDDYIVDQEDYSSTCLDLRQSDKSVIQNTGFYLVYTKIQLTKIISWINMGRSVFITLLLILASLLFIRDIDNYALIPIEKMSNTVQKIDENPFGVFMSKIKRIVQLSNSDLQARRNNQEKDQHQLLQAQLEIQELSGDILPQSGEDELQTNLLEKLLLKISYLLAIGAGQAATKLMTSNSDEEPNSYNQREQKTIEPYGVIMYIQIAHLNEIVRHLKEKSIKYLNSVCQCIHETVVEYGGTIFQQNNTSFVILWESLRPNLFGSACQIGKTIDTTKIGDRKKMSTLAFFAYLKIIQKLSNREKFQIFNLEDSIQNFNRYKIHCSLNIGSSLCGIVGSQFKMGLKAIGHDLILTKKLCQIAEKNQTSIIMSELFMKSCQISKGWERKIGQIHTLRQDQQLKYDEKCCIYTAQILLKRQSNEQIISKQLSKMEEKDTQMKQKLIRIFQSKQEILQKLQKYKIEDVTSLSLKGLLNQKNPIYEDWMELWQEAYEAYQNRQWNKALNAFQLSISRYSDIPDIYPESPEVIGLNKVKQIKKWKQNPPRKWRNYQFVSLQF